MEITDRNKPPTLYNLMKTAKLNSIRSISILIILFSLLLGACGKENREFSVPLETTEQTEQVGGTEETGETEESGKPEQTPVIPTVIIGKTPVIPTVIIGNSGSSDSVVTASKKVVLLFSIDDNVVSYYVSEKQTAPGANSFGWKNVRQTSYSTVRKNEFRKYSVGANSRRVETDFKLSGYGVKKVRVWVKDGYGSVSSAGSARILVTGPITTRSASTTNSAGPTEPSIIINGGDLITVTKDVKLTLSAKDGNGVTGYYLSLSQVSSDVPETPDTGSTGWYSVSSTSDYSVEGIPFTLSGALGIKTIYVWFKNSAGNISQIASAEIQLIDAGSPHDGSIVIKHGTTDTPSTEVTLDRSVKLNLRARDNVKVTEYYLSENSKTPTTGKSGWVVAGGENYEGEYSQDDISFSLSAGVGEKRVYAWFKNSSDRVSEPVYDDITLADTPSSVSVTINSGDASTKSTAVTLTLGASGETPIIAYYVSEDQSIPGTEGWESVMSTKRYSKHVPFALSNNLGQKTVYVWFKNSAGIISSVVNDEIELRRILAGEPTGSITINSGVAGTASSSVTLNLKADDDNGITGYYVSETPTTPTTSDPDWKVVSSEQHYTGDVPFGLSGGDGEKTVYVWFKDVDSHLSGRYSASIHKDDAPPSGSVRINNGAMGTDSYRVMLNLSATDSSGVAAYYASYRRGVPPATDSNAWKPISKTTNYAGNIWFTFFSGNGEKRVNVWYKDVNGNISDKCSASIIVDNIRPTGSVTIANGNDIQSTDVTLTLEADDNISVVGYYLSRGQTPPTSGSAWVAVPGTKRYSADVNFTLPDNAGTARVIYAWYIDVAGNISFQSSDSIRSGVPTGTVAINGGASVATSPHVVLTLNASSKVAGQIKYHYSEERTQPTPSSTWHNMTKQNDFNYTTPAHVSLSGEDGDKTMYVWFKDAADKISNRVEASILLDAHSPVGSLSINGDDEATNSFEVDLNLSATDAIGVTGYFISSNQNIPTTSTQGWEIFPSAVKKYENDLSRTLSSGDGIKRIYVWYRDSAGNISASYNDTIIVDATPPSSGSVAINNGATHTTSRNVNLILTATDLIGVAKYYASENTTPPIDASNWLDMATSGEFELSTGDGDKTVYVWFKDKGDNLSARYSDTIIMDTSIPVGSIDLNNGDDSTTSRDVTLALIASDNFAVTGYYISESATTPVLSSSWPAFASSVSFKFSLGDGTKNVYVWYRDEAGNLSARQNAAILMDTTPPTGSIKINDGEDSTVNHIVSLALSAADNIQMESYYVSESDTKPTASSQWNSMINNVQFQISSGNGNKIVYVWYRDGVGNISDRYSDSILISSIPPTGSIKIDDDPAVTDPRSVILTLSAYDADEVASYYVSETATSPTTSTHWTAIANANSFVLFGIKFVLSTGEGSKTVYVWYKDRQGNVSDVVSSSFIVGKPSVSVSSGSIQINNGDSFTASRDVTLALTASDSDGVSGYYVSESDITPTRTGVSWLTVSNNVNFKLSSGDGLKRVYFWFIDRDGQISSRYSDSISIDNSAPTSPSLTINSGDGTTSSNSVTLSFSARDNVGITAYYISDDPTKPDSSSNWHGVTSSTSYSETADYTLASGEGDKTVYIWFKDIAGNVSDQASDTIRVVSTDSSKPVATKIVINGGATTSTNDVVRLAIAAHDNIAVVAYYLSESATTPSVSSSGWHSVTAEQSYLADNIEFPVSRGNGIKTIYAWFKDQTGNISDRISNTIKITVTDTAVIGNLEWQRGQASARLIFTDAKSYCERLGLGGHSNWRLPTASELRSVYDSSASSAPYIISTLRRGTMEAAKRYPATSGFSRDPHYWSTTRATYHSHGGWKNENGVIAFNYYYSSGHGDAALRYILFDARCVRDFVPDDTTAPSSPSIIINNGDSSTRTNSVSLSFSARDNVGITAYYISDDPTKPDSSSNWHGVTSSTSYSETADYTLASGEGDKTVYIWFKDIAGNVSDQASDTIRVVSTDSSKPVATKIVINGGATTSTNDVVRLAIAAHDNIAVVAYYLSESATTPSVSSSGWHSVTAEQSYSADNIEFPVSRGNGIKTIYAWFKDQTGNISDRISNTIKITVTDTAVIGNLEWQRDQASAKLIFTYAKSYCERLGLGGHSNWRLPTASELRSVYDSSASSAPYIISTLRRGTMEAAKRYPATSGFSRDPHYWSTTRATYHSYGGGKNENGVIAFNYYYSSGHGDAALRYVMFDARCVRDIVPDDTTAPSSPSIIINSGDSSTRTNSVSLSLSAMDDVGVTAYYVSESSSRPAINSRNWHRVTSTPDFHKTVTHTLSDGVGSKVVYAWFKDAKNNMSPAASDGIRVIIPVSRIGDVQWETGWSPTKITHTAAVDYCSNLVSASFGDWRLPTVSELSTFAKTDRHGMNGSYWSSERDLGWDVYTYVNMQSSLSSRPLPSNARYHVRCIRFYKEDTGPPGSVSIRINDGSPAASDGVFLTISAKDDMGVSAYYLSTTPSTPLATSDGWHELPTEKTDYSESGIPFLLKRGYSGVSRSVYVWFKDLAGNISSMASDSTTIPDLDTVRIENVVWQDYGVQFENYSEAVKFCKQISLRGHHDWRLPTVAEFQTIDRYGDDYDVYKKDGIYIDVRLLRRTKPGSYWTASKTAGGEVSIFHFRKNKKNYDSVTSNMGEEHYIRCIRTF